MMTGNQTLTAIIHERLHSGKLDLPVFHPSAAKIQQMLSQQDVDLPKVSATIMADSTLAGNVLRVANSTFFSGLSHVATIHDAVKRLGTKQILSIVILVTQRAKYDAKSKLLRFYSKPLWHHAVACGIGAKWLAVRLGHSKLVNEAFLAGLLHDIGHLLLLKVLDDICLNNQSGINLTKAMVDDILENFHTTYGSILLRNWNFPDIYCEIVRDHHCDENYYKNNVLLNIVRIVNLVCKKLNIGLVHDPDIVLATSNEACNLDVSELILAELEIAIEDALSLA